MKTCVWLAFVVGAALVLPVAVRAQDKPILPEKDPPAADAAAVKYLPAASNQHPRLLLNAAGVAQLKAFYDSPEGKTYRTQLEGRLRICGVPKDRVMGPSWAPCQEHGLDRMPTVALHYLLTKDKASFDKAVAYLKWMAGTADWTDGGEPAVEDTPAAYAKVLEKMQAFGPSKERNSDYSASFMMVGAALTWDWLYHDLDPAFREQFRQILWQHARAMYYGGHKSGNPGGFYWVGIPAYNHRWFRDWGLALAALGAGEGKPDEQWFLGEVEKELKYVDTWMSPDGSQHEGPGYGASAGGLGMAFQASDDLTGTHYLDIPFFKMGAAYTVDISAPGMTEAFYFADCWTKLNSFHPFFLKTAALGKQVDVMDGIRHALAVNKGGSPWMPLIFDDPNVKGGDYRKRPTAVFLPDLGISIIRESWQDKAVAAMFKCGPMGGYKANAWAATTKVGGGGRNPNVAHDHPDANSFMILADGEYLAETDRYCTAPGKLSTSVNTILVNGIGQANAGRSEGEVWTQPGTGDLTQQARITAYKDAGNVVVTEGEAAGSYLDYTDAKTKMSRPALDRFRRTFIWVKDGYVLVFDDIRSPQPVEITWLIQGAKLTPVNAAEGRYQLAKGQAASEFQLISDVALQSKLGVSTANDHGKMLNWQQLQAGTAASAAARFACVVDPWHKDVKVTLKADGPDQATLTVTGTGINDTWQWQAAKGKFEAASWHGSRPGGFAITVDAKTAVPPAL